MKKQSTLKWNKLRNPNALKIASEYAKSKEGTCLSTEYVNADTKLIWKCHNPDHPIWESTYISVIHHSSWCPECNLARGIQEFRAKNILEYLLDTTFKKRKDLDWNINPKTGRKLELDGYSTELNIAFEFQGEHHHKIAFGKDQNTLINIQNKDLIKKQNCINNNVKLIIVNILSIKDRNNVIAFTDEILRALNDVNIKIKKEFNKEDINLLFYKVKRNTVSQEYFDKLKLHVLKNNGTVLTPTYINRSTKMMFKCGIHHHNPWEATYGNIINCKSWCPECNGGSLLKNGLEKANLHAIAKKGQCLSLEYINARSKLEWKCHNPNHKSWYARYTKVLNEKTWCPECSKEKKS